ncbi:hypothetical protein [Mammaliicoccus sciuri]|uniref:hypothetical protein n=1 Tax=Mammaliicoccus sciuri TaxID=1296 RepID=UPI003F554463
MKVVKWFFVIISPVVSCLLLMLTLIVIKDTVWALITLIFLNFGIYGLFKLLNYRFENRWILIQRKHPFAKLILGTITLYMVWLGMGLNLDKIDGTGSVNVTLNAQVIALLVSLSYGFILLILNYEESMLD